MLFEPNLKMNLVLIFLISKVRSESIGNGETALQKIASGRLCRMQAGFEDSLLIVGEEFSSEDEFKAYLEPYGLADADLAVIQDSYDEVRGKRMKAAVGSWLYKKHPAAVSFIECAKYCDSGTYPLQGWWWTGVETYEEELSTVYAKMIEFVPYDYKKQVATWLALVLEERINCLSENDAEDYETSMLAISLSRWLTGFDAITDNNSYDFDYRDAVNKFTINPFRLGFEAGQTSSDDLSEQILSENTKDDELPAILLQHCLDIRNSHGEIPLSLKERSAVKMRCYGALTRASGPICKSR